MVLRYCHEIRFQDLQTDSSPLCMKCLTQAVLKLLLALSHIQSRMENLKKKVSTKIMTIKAIVLFLLNKFVVAAGLKIARVRSKVKLTIIQELTISAQWRPTISSLHKKNIFPSFEFSGDTRLMASFKAGIHKAMVSDTVRALRYIPPGSFLQRRPLSKP